MLYKRQGIPEVNEIVLCKVTKIFPSSVFIDLLEFPGKSGIVHISEVSPGRIRNLRDYVSVGRQIVCKILRVDRDKGHIDLSLRRVNSTQRREKLDEIKQELKAESLIKNLAKKLKTPYEELYKQVTQKVFEDYSHLYLCFRDVVADEVDLEKLGLAKKVAAELKVAIIDKFKPSKITIEGEIEITTYDSDGVKKIKATLEQVQKVSPKVTLFYLGAGRYKLIIEDVEYLPAEKNLDKIEAILEKFNTKHSTAKFERDAK